MLVRSLLAAALTFAAMPQLAQAVPIVHDTAAEFVAPISYNPALRANGTAVDAGRQITGNMFDNSLTTITSLGRGGNIALEIAPATGRFITGGQIIELTGGTANFPERANIFLGVDQTGWVQIGTMSNGHAPNTGGWSNVNSAVVTVSYVAGGSPAGTNPTFNFVVVSGFYDSVQIVDIPLFPSPPPTGAALAQYDGFDIAEFEVTSNLLPLRAVPEPMALSLFGLSLLGLGLARRARTR